MEANSIVKILFMVSNFLFKCELFVGAKIACLPKNQTFLVNLRQIFTALHKTKVIPVNYCLLCGFFFNNIL